MTIQAEIQSLSPSAVVELFTLDSTNLPGGTLLHFHAGTNELRQPVIWQGVEYSPLPIEAEGFDISTQGTLPRPKIRIANIDGLMSAAARESDDLIGTKVVRKRTFVKYLDGANFTGGTNPAANPDMHFPDDIWYVDQKTAENRYVIEWELASAFDLQGVTLPGRQVVQNSCWWRYRGPECNYTGGYFDKNDRQTSDPASDFCAKRLASCRARHVNVIVPFGGYPGSVRNG